MAVPFDPELEDQRQLRLAAQEQWPQGPVEPSVVDVAPEVQQLPPAPMQIAPDPLVAQADAAMEQGLEPPLPTRDGAVEEDLPPVVAPAPSADQRSQISNFKQGGGRRSAAALLADVQEPGAGSGQQGGGGQTSSRRSASALLADLPDEAPVNVEGKTILGTIGDAFKRGWTMGDLAREMEAPQPNADRVFALQQEMQKLPPSPEYVTTMRDDVSPAESWQAFKSNPVGVLGELMGESLAAFGNQMIEKAPNRVAIGLGAGAALGAPVAGIGAVPGGFMGAGAGFAEASGAASYALEMSSGILEALEKSGVPMDDPQAMRAALADPERMQVAREFAQRKAVPIAIFDGGSALIAGRLGGKPASALAKVGEGFAETFLQGAMGAAGEASGQLAQSGEIRSARAILAEGVAEVPTGLAEIGVGALTQNAADANRPAGTAPAAAAAPSGVQAPWQAAREQVAPTVTQVEVVGDDVFGEPTTAAVERPVVTGEERFAPPPAAAVAAAAPAVPTEETLFGDVEQRGETIVPPPPAGVAATPARMMPVDEAPTDLVESWSQLPANNIEGQDQLNATATWSQNTNDGAPTILYGEVKRGDAVVGRIQVGQRGDIVEIDKVWVAPSERRQGVAKKLIYDAMRRSGVTKAYAPNRTESGAKLLQSLETEVVEDGETVDRIVLPEAAAATTTNPKAATRAKARIKNMTAQSGAVDLSIVEDLVQYGQAIYRTGMTYAQWSAEMVREFGQAVAQFLRQAFDRIVAAYQASRFSDTTGAVNVVRGRRSAGGIRFDQIAKEDPKHDGSRVGTAWQGKVRPTTQQTNDGIETVTQEGLEKQMAKLTQFVTGVPLPKYITKIQDARQRMRAFIDFQKGNLLALYDAFDSLSSEYVIRSTHWYDGARLLAEGIRDRYNVTVEQSAAIMAVFSPMKDWFQNVAMAQRFSDVMANYRTTKITKARMGAAMDEMLGAASDSRTIRRIFKLIEGKSIAGLLRDRSKAGRKMAAVAVRLMSTHVHGLTHDVLSPEGESLGIRKNLNGSKKKMVWQSYTFIEKAISVYEDGSLANISKVLGNKHKIRNFYNNIVAPTSPVGDATVDTHAVNAAVLYPMGNKGYLVGLSFGTAGMAGGGNSGLYWIFHQALREAAAERGVSPRQMQSITWEAIRGLFTDVRKRDKNFIATIKNIWKNSNDANTARSQIIGLGITPPEWARVAGADPGSQGGVGEVGGSATDTAGSVRPGVRQGRQGGTAGAGVTAQRIRQKLTAEAGGIDASIIQDLADYGVRFYRAGMDLATWSGQMVREFGQAVGKYLREAFNRMLQAYRDSPYSDTTGAVGDVRPKAKPRQFEAKARQNEALAPETRARLGSEYIPISLNAQSTAAKEWINTNGLEAAKLRIAQLSGNDTTPTPLDFAIGIEASGRLSATGDHAGAAGIVSTMSQRATSLGQTISVLAMMARLTPEGIVLYGQNIVSRYINTLSPEAQERIKALQAEVDRLRTALADMKFKEGSEVIRSGKLGDEKIQDRIKRRVKARVQADLGPAAAGPEVPAETKARTQGLNRQVRDVLLSDGKQSEMIKQITQILTSQGNMPAAEAEAVGKSIVAAFTKIVTETRRKYVEGAKRGAGGRRGGFDALLKLLASKPDMTDGEFVSEISQLMGLPGMTPALARELRALGQRYENATDPDVKLVIGAMMFEKAHELVPVDFWVKVRGFAYLSMLFAPKTWIRNVIGNQIQWIFNVGRDAVVSGIMDPAMSLLTGQRTTAGLKLGARLKGLLAPIEDVRRGYLANKQFVPEANFLKNFMAGVNHLRMLSKLTTQNKFEIADVRDVGARIFSSRLMRAWEGTLSIALGAGDRAFWMSQFRASLAQMQAAAEKNGEWTGQPTPEMIEAAMAEAAYAIYQNPNIVSANANKIRGALNRLSTFGKTDQYGLGTGLMAFTQVPGSITLRGLIEWSPLGMIPALYRGMRGILYASSTGRVGAKFDQAAFNKEFTQALLGTGALYAAGYYLYALGIVTASREDDDDLEAMRRASGGGAYRINLTALRRALLSGNWFTRQEGEQGDVIVPYDWAQPVAITFAAGAELAAQVERNSREQLKKGLAEKAGMAAMSLAAGAKSLEELPLLSGLSSFIKTWGYAGPLEALTATVAGMPSQFVPQLVRQAGQINDNLVRETRGGDSVVQREFMKVLASVPGYSTKFPVRFDITGQAIQRYQYGGNSVLNVFFSPAMASEVKRNPVLQEVSRLVDTTGETSMVPRQVKRGTKINGVDVDLTNDQLAAYSYYLGNFTMSHFTWRMAAPVYARLPDEVKVKMLAQDITDIDAAVKSAVLGHDMRRLTRNQMFLRQALVNSPLGQSVPPK